MILDELEELGETEVRERLARGEYGPKGLDRQIVEDWLHMKVQSRSINSNREQRAMRIAIIVTFAGIIAAVPLIIMWPS